MTLLRVGLCPQITAPVLQRLNGAGMRTVLDILSCSLEELSGRTGVPYRDAVDLRRSIIARFAAAPVNGAELYEKLSSSRAILSSGSRRVDRFLGGGIYSGELTEIVGASGSGKTQMCHCLIASLLSDTANFGALYVDTLNSFSSHRLQQTVNFRQQQRTAAVVDLGRALRVSVRDMPQMLCLLSELRQGDLIQKKNIKLLVVDSVTSLFAPLLHGQLLGESLGLLAHLGTALSSLAHHSRLAIVLVNDQVTVAGSGAKPALGKQWAHVPSVSVRLEHVSEGSDLRRITLTKSSREPSGGEGMLFRIGPMGITSVIEKGEA